MYSVENMTARIIENPSYRDRVSIFRDRFQAGKLLTEKLSEYANDKSAIVLGMPAGGSCGLFHGK